MARLITSLQNERVKQAVKLRDRRGRERQQRIIIDGVREVQRAFDAGVELLELFVCSELCAGDASRRLTARTEQAGVEQLFVTPAVFAKLAFGERAEGLLAVARPPRRTLVDLELPENPLIAVVEGIEKPGNIGAILRSADGAGLAAVVVADGGTDLFNPNTIRASLGTIFSVPVCAAGSWETLEWLRQRKFQIIATQVQGGVDYTEISYTRSTAIVLGAEAGGLSEIWSSAEITAISLPMRGVADSLNVSATAAILFYEALRQRTAASGSGHHLA